MPLVMNTPLTGAAVGGFTSPTWNIFIDTPPAPASKQWMVSGGGGTIPNVEFHSASKPFTIAFFRPQVPKVLGPANPTTGVIKQIPNNVYKVITRKGMLSAANQVPSIGRITTIFEIPSGTDTYEPDDLRALVSAHIGTLWAESVNIEVMCRTSAI